MPDVQEQANREQHLQPSKAWEQATDSPVYRLSELMFGSLLASYVLGFIGVSAAALARHSESAIALRGGTGVVVFESAAISIAFAYLTAGSYLTYHAGILTMFHMPLRRLRWDFALALTQAVSFGLSLLFPESFLLMLGVVLLTATKRQRHECNHFVSELWVALDSPGTVNHTSRPDREPPDSFIAKFELSLRKYPELSGWKRPSLKIRIATIVFLTLGAVAIYWLDNRLLPEVYRIPSFLTVLPFPAGPYALVVALTTIAIVSYCHKSILKGRAGFLMDRASAAPAMDREFETLKTDLRK